MKRSLSVRLRKGSGPSWPTLVPAVASEKCMKVDCSQTHNTLFLIAPTLASPTSMNWATPCVLLAPSFPTSDKPSLPFQMGPIHPSQIGASGSGVYTVSRVRKKDQRDPREKRFTTSVLFIVLSSSHSKLPPLAQWLHCAPALRFSRTCKSTLLGVRGECRESENVRREMRVLWACVCVFLEGEVENLG